MAPEITIAIPSKQHRTLKRIADRKGWKLKFAAAQAVKALDASEKKLQESVPVQPATA